MAKYQTNKTKRAVYNTLRCIGVMLFGQNRFKQPKFLENAAQKDKYEVWLGMIDEGKINEVENELIEETEQRRPDMHPSESEKMAMLEVALQIYKYINDKDDAFLERSSYSREEVVEGILSVMHILHIDTDMICRLLL